MPNGGSANTEQIPAAILTLAVTQQEAEKIILAGGTVSGSQYSGLYLALQTGDSKLQVGDPGTNSSNLFGN